MTTARIIAICVLLMALVLFLLLLPITAKAKLYIDLISLKMFYVIKIFGIKLLSGTTEITNGKFDVHNTHNIILKKDKESQKKEGLFLRQLVKNTNIHKAEFYFDFGTHNAYSSSIVSGYAQVLFAMLTSYILTKNKYAHISEGVVTHYNHSTCEFAMQFVLGISVINILKSKIVANHQHKENINGK